MSDTRALPDLVSRIRVDSTGVGAAITELEQGFTKANLKMAAAAAGIGLLIAGGKSAMDIAEKHEKAESDLAQALAQSKVNAAAYRAEIDKFIASNKSFVSDQSEVIDNFAKLTRAGLSAKESQRVMNDAVDLAALKNISLSDAVDVLNAAEHGRMKGLISLGITTSQLTDKNGHLVKGQKAIALAMDEVDKKVAHGRETLTQTQQASNRLSNSWQDISNKVGPPLLDLFNGIVGALASAVDWLNKLGDDAAWNKSLASAFGHVQDAIVGVVKWIEAFIADIQWLQSNTFGKGSSSNQAQASQSRRAGGGPVVPGSIYTVGEEGPETLVMGARGGYVIPNGGTSRGSASSLTVVVNVSGHVQTERSLNMAIREGIRRLDREHR